LMQEADRTRRIVQNLLDFARQRQPERQSTSLSLLVQRTLDLHAYALGTGRIEVRQDLPDDLPAVDADPAQIQQVLLNLTLNAIQSIRSQRRPGRITISARTRRDAQGDEWVRLSIHDDGPGVAPAAQAHLFEPFFTTKEVGEGTGLGLSVSYGIVASHGGRLWHEPPADQGATFVVELPAGKAPVQRMRLVVPQSPPAAAQAGTRHAGAATGRILAIDDEPSVRGLLERSLSRAGHQVTLAGSGADALREARQKDFDLMLIDHRMSAMDGIETYRRLVELRPGLRGRAVVMSGDTLNPALREFAVSHGLRMLAKPFDVASLLTVIDEELRGADEALTESRR
ncbi:MAG: ATP-binding protein, partial [Chloroflexota bacterium]|nr:ATP-binding protein [Chloroflexota bacterium]